MADINVHITDAVTGLDVVGALVEVNAVYQAYDPYPVPVEFQSMFGYTDATGVAALSVPTEGIYYQLFISATGYARSIETITGENGETYSFSMRPINLLSGSGIVKGTAFVLKASESTRVSGGTVYAYDGSTEIPTFIQGTATIYGTANDFCKQVYLNSKGEFSFTGVPAGNTAGPYMVRVDIAGRIGVPSGIPLAYNRLTKDLTNLYTSTTTGFCIYVRTVPGVGVIGGPEVEEEILSPESGEKPVAEGTFSISGTVIDTQGNAIPGTRVFLNNGTSSLFTSTADYEFGDVGKGGYVVQCEKTGYTFFPTYRVLVIDARSAANVDFVGYRPGEIGDETFRTGSISGRVYERSGAGISDVSFFLDETAISPTSYNPATSPNYIISGLTGIPPSEYDDYSKHIYYTLRVSKVGWAFTPIYRTAGMPAFLSEGAQVWDHTNIDFFGVPDLTLAIKVYSARASDPARYRVDGVLHMSPDTHSLLSGNVVVGLKDITVSPELYVLHDTIQSGEYSAPSPFGVAWFDDDGTYFTGLYMPVVFSDTYRLVDWFSDTYSYDPKEPGTVTFHLFVERTYAVTVPVETSESEPVVEIALKLTPEADPPEEPAPVIEPTVERPDSTGADLDNGGAVVSTDESGIALVMAPDGGYTLGGRSTITGIQDVRS